VSVAAPRPTQQPTPTHLVLITYTTGPVGVQGAVLLEVDQVACVQQLT
jgi:hypothetical protein